jgi:hypothetical protein
MVKKMNDQQYNIDRTPGIIAGTKDFAVDTRKVLLMARVSLDRLGRCVFFRSRALPIHQE